MYLGPLDENIGALIYGNLYKILGSNWSCFLGTPDCYYFDLQHTNQFLFWSIFYLFAFKIDTFLLVNLLIIFTTIVSIFVFFKFFSYFFENKLIPFLLSLILMFSPYFHYKLYIHYDLAQFWMFVLIFLLILKAKNILNFGFAGLLLGLFVGISNYLAYFSIIFITLFLISSFLLNFFKKINVEKHYLKLHNLVVFYLIFLFSGFLVMLPYIKGLSSNINSTQSEQLSRTIEDFIIFSSRPWYYILPPVDNPFFGWITENFIDYFSVSTKNYLFNNYFKSEHSISFLGILNLIMSLIGIYQVLKFEDRKVKSIVNPLVVTFIAIVLISMPPKVTLNGLDILLPSYINYEIFPMFRVLSRIGVFALFITLIFTGFGYKFIVNKFKIGKYYLFIFFSISLIEFFIPLKITYSSTVPNMYQYISNQLPSNSIISVYPESRTRDYLYWIPFIKRPFANPKDFVSTDGKFISSEFTKNLNTAMGIEYAKERGINYILIFEDELSTNTKIFLNNSPLLIKKYNSYDNYSLQKFCDTNFIKCNNTSNLGNVGLYEIK